MSFMLSRIFTYFTLFMYLVVGVVVVRVFSPDMATVEVSTSYLKYFSKTEFKSPVTEEMSQPQIAFEDIKFPVEKKVVVKAKPVVKTVPKAIVHVEKTEEVSKHELPFAEPVKLSPVVMKQEIVANNIALYTEFKYEMIADVQPVESDEVSTKLASNEEPEFFEYPVHNDEAEAPAATANTEVVSEESTNPQIAQNVEEVKNVDNSAEEIAIDELISFDYSPAGTEVQEPVVQASVAASNVTTQIAPKAAPLKMVAKSSKSKAPKAVTTQVSQALTSEEQSMGFMQETAKSYYNRVTIQITGTDFKKTQEEVGFEVRPQDDLRESFFDYNNGQVVLEQDMANPKMTRSIAVVKRGFATTNTDLILEEGASEVTLPMIEESAFNAMMAPYESRGFIGAVLVELEDDVESATLDVPFSKVLNLDENLKVTSDSNFAYQLFVGVQAGNALLSYKGVNGEVTSKVIHIHDHELTFETNFFEAVENEKVALVEEDLLGKEKQPLIISSQEVRQFATDKTAKKINNHTFKTDFRKTLLGGRKYLELGHQQEPVFVGFKENTKLEIPSENFMRYILSKFENAQLGDRCLIQVNLSKKAVSAEVAPESVNASLQTYTQILDADGKFYDSVGEKSEKIIVVGENQGSDKFSKDAKVNFKITYQDGSIQYLGSYCSPNSYLVEQL